MNEGENLSKYELKKQKKLDERGARTRRHAFYHLKRFAIPATLLLVFVGLFFWLFSSAPLSSENQIISRNGLHWHPQLEITVKGEKQEISADIGLGAIHNPVHTHDDTGIIHLEFSGLVSSDNVKLAKFFEAWGKRFDSECIFDFCNGPEGTVQMFVNGKLSEEFENHLMRDGDKIEIRYE